MPKKLVAHTGMDALTHAIEAYVSTAHTATSPIRWPSRPSMIVQTGPDRRPINGDMAKPRRDAQRPVPGRHGLLQRPAGHRPLHGPQDRRRLLRPAHIIHGLANAMYLPKVIAYNAKDDGAAERYAAIADFMSLGGDTTEEKIKRLIAELRHMNDELNIPHCIKNYGADSYPTENGFVPENVFLDSLHRHRGQRHRRRLHRLQPPSAHRRRRWRSCSSAATTTLRWTSNPSPRGKGRPGQHSAGRRKKNIYAQMKSASGSSGGAQLVKKPGELERGAALSTGQCPAPLAAAGQNTKPAAINWSG